MISRIRTAQAKKKVRKDWNRVDLFGIFPQGCHELHKPTRSVDGPLDLGTSISEVAGPEGLDRLASFVREMAAVHTGKVAKIDLHALEARFRCFGQFRREMPRAARIRKPGVGFEVELSVVLDEVRQQDQRTCKTGSVTGDLLSPSVRKLFGGYIYGAKDVGGPAGSFSASARMASSAFRMRAAKRLRSSS